MVPKLRAGTFWFQIIKTQDFWNFWKFLWKLGNWIFSLHIEPKPVLSDEFSSKCTQDYSMYKVKQLLLPVWTLCEDFAMPVKIMTIM